MPLRKLLFAACLLCTSALVFCQDRDDARDSSFFQFMHLKKIKLKNKDGDKDTLPFSSVSIIDARYDTLSLGFKYPGYPVILNRYERMVFEDNAGGEEIKNYITGNYQFTALPDSAYKLVIVLDKFWFTYTMLRDSGRVGLYRDGLIIKANMLAERNGMLHPLFQLDTIYTRRLLHTNDNATMLQRGIDKMFDKVRNKNIGELKISKRELSNNDIATYVQHKTGIPILHAAEYNKGIYMSFEEFRNNAPSITHYETVMFKKNIKALRGWDKDSTAINVKKAWGFCDGQNVYISGGDDFFLLYKLGNTFVARGYKSATYVETMDLFIFESGFVLPVPAGGSYRDIKMPLQVDMETGELF